MSGISLPLRAVMEDGTTWDVVADQRDAADWEMQEFGTPFLQGWRKGVLLTRWLAWRAGKRRKLHTLSWEKFSEACLSVDDVPSEDTDAGDPGRRTASDSLS